MEASSTERKVTADTSTPPILPNPPAPYFPLIQNHIKVGRVFFFFLFFFPLLLAFQLAWIICVHLL